MVSIEFNPDGSMKLPENIVKKREDDEKIFREEPSIRITRDQISQITPLKCELTIGASDKLKNPERIESFYNYAKSAFEHMAQLSIQKLSDKEYVVTIVSGQFRCSWCENFRKHLGKELNAKIINQGSCFYYTKAGKFGSKFD